MEQPLGSVNQVETWMVCKFKNSFYGLNNLPVPGFVDFLRLCLSLVYWDVLLITLCFTRNLLSVQFSWLFMLKIYYYRHWSKGIMELKHFLKTKFHNKDLGNIKCFSWYWNWSFITRYIFISEEICSWSSWWTGLLGCQLVDFLIDHNIKLENIKCDILANEGRYRRLVRKLHFLRATHLIFPLQLVW